MTNDGTQDPVPPPVLSDPLAGLVTGSRYEPESLRVRVTAPPPPDIAAVREAMAYVLDENSELDLNSIIPASEFFTDSTGESAPERPAPEPPAAASPPVAQVPVKDVPASGRPAPARIPVPTRGGVTRVNTTIPAPRGRPGTARALPPAIVSGERTRRIRLPRGFVSNKPKLPPAVKGQSSAWSVTLIMVLLIVMGVLGIVFLASLIDTIAAVFD
ncbi:MAG TPA: hypothetical protein VGP26_14495 [Actinophytocola sp.]|jgi:hypothetical protein|nr:hypothetical protein [Actinophytocola sp.]